MWTDGGRRARASARRPARAGPGKHSCSTPRATFRPTSSVGQRSPADHFEFVNPLGGQGLHSRRLDAEGPEGFSVPTEQGVCPGLSRHSQPKIAVQLWRCADDLVSKIEDGGLWSLRICINPALPAGLDGVVSPCACRACFFRAWPFTVPVYTPPTGISGRPSGGGGRSRLEAQPRVDARRVAGWASDVAAAAGALAAERLTLYTGLLWRGRAYRPQRSGPKPSAAALRECLGSEERHSPGVVITLQAASATSR